MAFSPDSSLLAVVVRDGSDTEIRLIDTETRTVEQVIPRDMGDCNWLYGSDPRTLGFSPGGLYFYHSGSCENDSYEFVERVSWHRLTPSSDPPPPIGTGTCGDGIVDGDEVCDDGDNLDGDLCSADCTSLHLDCSYDESWDPGGPAQFGVEDARARDIVALCDGWILLPDPTTNQVHLYNPWSATVMRSYQLTSVPDQLAFDPNAGVLYVSSNPAHRVEKVWLESGTVERIATSHALHALTLRKDGWIFGSFEVEGSQPYRPDYHTSIIDGTNATHVTDVAAEHGRELIYDHDRNVLIGAYVNYTIGEVQEVLVRSQFDPTGPDLSVLETSAWSEAVATPALSSDGATLAYPIDPDRGLLALDPTDTGVDEGAWVTERPAEVVALNPARPEVAIVTHDENGLSAIITVFDVITGSNVSSYDLSLCYHRVSSPPPSLVAISGGGQHAYVVCPNDNYRHSDHLVIVDLDP